MQKNRSSARGHLHPDGLNIRRSASRLSLDAATAERVTGALRGEAKLNNSQQWLALNIEAGLPIIDAANSAPVYSTGH